MLIKAKIIVCGKVKINLNANLINNAIIALLTHNYPAAAVNQKFVPTYEVYNKGATANVTKTFQYNGTTFVKVN